MPILTSNTGMAAQQPQNDNAHTGNSKEQKSRGLLDSAAPLLITCDCSCGDTLAARMLDGQVYLDFLSSDFGTMQSWSGRIRLALKIFFGNRLLKDIICTEDELRALLGFLESASYAEDDPTDNDSHLIVQYDDLIGFQLFLISDIPPLKALLFKNHRAFEISLSRKERDMLAKRIKRQLKRHGNKEGMAKKTANEGIPNRKYIKIQ